MHWSVLCVITLPCVLIFEGGLHEAKLAGRWLCWFVAVVASSLQMLGRLQVVGCVACATCVV